MMRAMLHVGLVAAAAALPGLAGCTGEKEQKSTATYLLDRQHGIWDNVRETLQSDSPNWNLLRTLNRAMTQTLNRLDKDYAKPNKDEVRAKLEAIQKAFEEQVCSKADLSKAKATPKKGVKPEEIRAAFDKLDKDYQQLKEMTE